jgi:hypothetical protein
LSEAAVIPQNANEAWVLPSRGIVGMACLIVAESAIFIIFIVAYLYYLGKSLTGPTPHDVLGLPIFTSICLLSSSATVHAAVSALHHGKRSMCSLWLAATVLLGVSADLSRRTDDTDESFRNDVLLAGWIACDSCDCWPGDAVAGADLFFDW